MRENAETQPKIAIIGGGPVGMLAALNLAARGHEILLISPQHASEDRRTTALMMPAISLLEELSIWRENLRFEAGMLATMRIIDVSQRLIRAPTVSFQAQEIGQPAFGYNIPNTQLNRALNEKIASEPRITRCFDKVTEYHHHDDHITLVLQSGIEKNISLVVGADGKMSSARTAAGIKTHQWGYPQHALVLNFSHQLPHHNTANEFHTEQGPFTQVPLPGRRSSLVWVVKPQLAEQLLGFGLERLAAEIETYMHAMLGKITLEEDSGGWPPQSWPMGGAIPTKFAANRTILIGEAAHVFPPIGAQGLNLGIRDVIGLGEVLADKPEDPGHAHVIDAYNRHRCPDILLRTGLVHALNRTLLSNFLPLQLLRCAGLETLRQFSPLRGLMMREGLAPGSGLFSLLPRRI